MKITYIVNSRIPTGKAYGYTISKMCEQFSEQGAAVTLMVPAVYGSDSQSLFSYYGIKNNFSVKTLPCINRGESMSGPLSIIRLYLQNLSFAVSFFLLPIDGDSVVYVRDLYLVPLARLKTRNVFLETHFLQQREKRLRYFFNFAKGIIVTTNALKEALIGFGVSRQSIHVAHDAVDLSKFDVAISRTKARTALVLPQDTHIVVYTGNFRTMGMDKGISFVLNALSRTAKESVPLLFVAVGGSEADLAYYEPMVRTIGVTDRVRLIGRVSLDMLAIYQKAADVLIMPFPRNEHYSYYMSPLKMFEYMASGTPILASRLPSLEEILTDKSAYFFKPDDTEDFRKNLMRIIENYSEAEKRGLQAADDVREYTWEKRAGRILKFLGF